MFKNKHLLKLGEKENDAMRRGSAIHHKAEKYIKQPRTKLPAELSLFKEEFAEVRKIKEAMAEDTWTFDRQWQPCAWDDWDRAWLRVKVDLHWLTPRLPDEDRRLVVVDHKTGKLRKYKEDEYRMQLDLTALAGFVRYPEVQMVQPKLWYLDEGVIYPEEEELISRKEMPKMLKRWEKNVKPMFADTAFKPKPNNGCQYCPFSKAKGGDCKY